VNAHPGSYSLAIYRGDSYTWTFRVWEDPEHTVAVDLTGVEARAEVRVGTGQYVLEAVITLPNVIEVTLDAGVSAQLTGSGKWDLQLRYSEDVVYTLVAGGVTVASDVTR
jgi:hypothetical protein